MNSRNVPVFHSRLHTGGRRRNVSRQKPGGKIRPGFVNSRAVRTRALCDIGAMKSNLLAGIAASLVLLGGSTVAGAADASGIWAKNCASCHGRDGAGKTKAGHLSGAKDLTDAQYQKTFTDEVAFHDTKNGLVQDGKTKMRPFQDKLSDDEINALVAYVRGFAK